MSYLYDSRRVWSKAYVTYPRSAAGAPVYEASELIYDSGYLISANGFEKSEATAAECGMRGVLALIYEGGYTWGKSFGEEFGNGETLNRANSTRCNPRRSQHETSCTYIFCTPEVEQMNFIGNVVFKLFEIIYTLGSFIEKYYWRRKMLV